MINNVYGGSAFLQVNTYANTPYVNIGSLGAGQVRFNPSNRSMEVYDGASWIALASQAEVKLSPSAEEILRWGQQKMEEEQRLKDLASKNVTVADALAQLQRAEEQLKVVVALCEEESK